MAKKLRWLQGSEGGGYSKFIIFHNKFFYLHVLRIKPGESINSHLDIGCRYHNISFIRKDFISSLFYCPHPCGKIAYYQPDQHIHGAFNSTTSRKTMYILSLGWRRFFS